MPLRYFAALVVVLLLAGAAAFAAPTGSAIRPQFRLNDSAAAVQLAEQLARPLLFGDRMGTAQVAHLPEPLDIAAIDTMTDYRAGDVAYWDREQRIVVFLTDGADVPGRGLSLIGHISDGLDDLVGCHRNCLVTLDDSMGKSADWERTDG